MQDVNHALANLRQVLGIPTLDFDAAGNLTLVFNGEMLVNMAKIDDTTVELWTGLESIGRADDVSTLRRLLESNHLGEGTGFARLALAPNKDDFVLCERICVTPLDDKQFGERIVDFVRYASFWNSTAGRQLPTGRASTGSTELGDFEFMIRA